MYYGTVFYLVHYSTVQTFSHSPFVEHARVVPRFTGKTLITGKTAELPERPKNNRELKYAIQFKFKCLVMY